MSKLTKEFPCESCGRTLTLADRVFMTRKESNEWACFCMGCEQECKKYIQEQKEKGLK